MVDIIAYLLVNVVSGMLPQNYETASQMILNMQIL